MSQRDDDDHTADQWAYHKAEIARITARWRDGDLSVYGKRKAIADENRRYYGEGADPLLVRTGRRYELPSVLAAAAGVDEDVMTMALNARRHGGREAFDEVLLVAGSRRA